MSTPPIPARLRKAILFLRGEEDGARWLDELPGVMRRYADHWSLDLERISEEGAMSACVISTGTAAVPVVLKVPVDAEAGRQEGRLLDYWEHTGAVPRVLDRDPETGVLLIQRILPGETAWPHGGGEDAVAYGDLISRLNAPNPNQPPEVKPLDEVIEMRMDWARRRFENPEHRYPKADLDAAWTAFDRLRATADSVPTRILHTDLQAKNVLIGQGRLYAIDPMGGATGDLNAEVALWIAIQKGDTSINERIEQFAGHELLDETRLAAWTYVLAVAEYRRYVRASATRIETYLAAGDPERIARSVAP